MAFNSSHKYRLIAFDMDGTLVKEKNSWGTLHQYFGTKDKAQNNKEEYVGGGISYAEFMLKDAALWLPFKPTKGQMEQALSSYTLMPHSEQVIKKLKEEDIETVIVTGGLDILARKVATRLGIENVLANSFVFDDDGYLTEKEICNVDVMRKDTALGRFVQELNIPLSKCIAVGDSNYDAEFLKCAGLGIAFDPDPVLSKSASVVIYDLREILRYI
ncbi:MAG: HAD-IB family phosphatase [Methanocellales archaeon]|nr:HAD-IB family phosphatase [Methanocellales archaeon]MDD3292426.1 HAD-IB family phosphatase [Methanocellales archaeon]MDD5236012.1 HAD-IB family phosphatase [Methanocellales archaeon]MDD5485882.1 HAD-IB family phosphatase [Methanocellales archaeon]